MLDRIRLLQYEFMRFFINANSLCDSFNSNNLLVDGTAAQ